MSNYYKIAILTVLLCLVSINNIFSQGISLPPPELINFEAGGEDNQPSDSYIVGYNDNTVNVILKEREDNNKPILYFYKIKSKNSIIGLDTNWVGSKKSNAKFIDLSSGDYVIYYKYQNYLKQFSATQSIKLTVNRPWWRTWWFWAASFISLFGLFYGRERFLKYWSDEEKRHHQQIVELELKTLQLQMNPHFIFNALNSIQSYIMNNDSRTANSYLSKFSSLIRMFLDSSRNRYISLGEEIKLLTLYIEIESLRFEDKFDYKIEIESDVLKYYEIPTMILQPFIENAINHGLRYKKNKGFLLVKIFNRDNALICRVEDNGVGRKVSNEIQANSKKGYRSQGLKITAERLITYNKINNSDIEYMIDDLYPTEEDVGTVVEVVFPIN